VIDVLRTREEFRKVGVEQPGLMRCNKGGGDQNLDCNVLVRRTTEHELAYIFQVASAAPSEFCATGRLEISFSQG
jgi:hypothetical protein